MTLINDKDNLLVLGVCAALCLEVLLLLHQLRLVEIPISGFERKDLGIEVGEVLWKSNELRYRSRGSLSWRSLGKGDPIHADDLVMTGDSAEARLNILEDGQMLLGPDTLIRFSKSDDVQSPDTLSFELRQGIAQVDSRKKEVRLNLRGQHFKLGRKSEVVISASPVRAKTRVEVKSGELRSEGENSPPLTVKEGDSIDIGAKREISQVILPLRMVPSSPLDGALLALKAKARRYPVLFRWEGDVAERIEVSKEKNFFHATTFLADGKSAAAKLPAGIYYWRIVFGKRRSSAKAFKVKPQVGLKLLGPATDKLLDVKDPVKLAWQASVKALDYVIEVSTSEDFDNVIIRKTTQNPSLEITSLVPGTYYWRVRAEHRDFGRWPFSKAKPFKLKKYLEAPSPTGVKLLPSSSTAPVIKKRSWFSKLWGCLFPVAYAGTEEALLRFEWQTVKGASHYRLEISGSINFETPLKTVESTQNALEVSLPANRQYYWRVIGIEADGTPGAPSAVEKVSPKQMIEALERKKRAAARKKRRAARRLKREKQKREKMWEEYEREREIKRALAQALTEKTPDFFKLGVGWGGGYLFQNTNYTTGSTQSQGFPLGKWDLSFEKGMSQPDWSLRLWHQPLRYLTQDSVISATQSDLFFTTFGGQFSHGTPLALFGQSLRLGVQVEKLASFEKQSSTQVAVGSKLLAALVVSQSYLFGKLGGLQWRMDAEINLAPLGSVRGMGMYFRNILEPSKWGVRIAGALLKPRLEVSLDPSLRWVGTNNNRVFNTNLWLSFFFVGQFVD